MGRPGGVIPELTGMRLCETEPTPAGTPSTAVAGLTISSSAPSTLVLCENSAVKSWDLSANVRRRFVLFSAEIPPDSDGRTLATRALTVPFTFVRSIPGRPGELVATLWQRNKVYHLRLPPSGSLDNDDEGVHWYYRGTRVVELGESGAVSVLSGTVQCVDVDPSGNFGEGLFFIVLEIGGCECDESEL